MPALTNPNNISIATGRPPRDHGISGNYIYESATGTEVLTKDKRFLRIPTLLAAAAAAGLDVAVVTADKLSLLAPRRGLPAPTTSQHKHAPRARPVANAYLRDDNDGYAAQLIVALDAVLVITDRLLGPSPKTHFSDGTPHSSPPYSDLPVDQGERRSHFFFGSLRHGGRSRPTSFG